MLYTSPEYDEQCRRSIPFGFFGNMLGVLAQDPDVLALQEEAFQLGAKHRQKIQLRTVK
jgi:hypothetical protein